MDGSLQIEANNGHVEAQINNLHARESSSDSNEVLYSSIIQAQSVVCLMDPEVPSCSMIATSVKLMSRFSDSGEFKMCN